MTILHGDNTTQSRSKLVSLIHAAKDQNLRIERLESKKLTQAELESVLGSKSLFGQDKLVVIEELHSLPNSQRKKELINLLGTASHQDQIILWEKKLLTATMLKHFPQAQVLSFKASNHVFAWLDSLSGKKGTHQNHHQLFVQALESDGEVFCFLMLARQIRLLIQIKDSGQIKGPPFMISKLKKQASNFSLEQLLRIHRQLLEMDIAHKTSASHQTLAQDLDLLLFQL